MNKKKYYYGETCMMIISWLNKKMFVLGIKR